MGSVGVGGEYVGRFHQGRRIRTGTAPVGGGQNSPAHPRAGAARSSGAAGSSARRNPQPRLGHSNDMFPVACSQI